MLECVPNVSEGRDPRIIAALERAVVAAGADLVDVHRDPDHHRSVLTLLGEPEAVERAALDVARTAVGLIDLRTHTGVHPRLGALDVLPFVPLAGSSMPDAVAVAHRVGRAIAAELDLPVFFYEAAALRPQCRALPAIRAGGFEALPERLADPMWCPDVGPARPHPTAGATVVGARGVLIAFNAVLTTANVLVARAIARAIRESSGGLPAVRAIGVDLVTRASAQVAMNLVDYRRTPVAEVVARLDREAQRAGVAVRELELVGCAPADAIPDTVRPRIRGLRATQLLAPGLFRA
ncbi:MAG: glutamate formimidoyltransferase [Candidatus Rokubacteria bacterium]|nr:glutamate formimidoyltransferase [Candidatus Rokubacteria bacterium]